MTYHKTDHKKDYFFGVSGRFSGMDIPLSPHNFSLYRKMIISRENHELKRFSESIIVDNEKKKSLRFMKKIII